MNTTEKILFASTVKATGDVDGPGEFEAILSTAQLDRDNEIIDAGVLKLPGSIPIFADHDHSVNTQVGRGNPYYDTAGRLMVRGVFSRKPAAQQLRQDVMDGIVDSMSVGVISPVYQRDNQGVNHVVGGEVFEGSFAGVPANTGARIVAAKAGARNASSDQSKINEIHKLSVDIGADCITDAESKSFEADESIDFDAELKILEAELALADL